MRKCTECGAIMYEGYLAGGDYYCSEECLHKHFTAEEWVIMCSELWEQDENGDIIVPEGYDFDEDEGNDEFYWTTWEEIDEDDIIDWLSTFNGKDFMAKHEMNRKDYKEFVTRVQETIEGRVNRELR